MERTLKEKGSFEEKYAEEVFTIGAAGGISSFDELYGEEAECENVHTGLECGTIMRNCPSVKDTISIGPTILNAHTVSEVLDIESVNKVYALLDKVLQNINAKKK